MLKSLIYTYISYRNNELINDVCLMNIEKFALVLKSLNKIQIYDATNLSKYTNLDILKLLKMRALPMSHKSAMGLLPLLLPMKR